MPDYVYVHLTVYFVFISISCKLITLHMFSPMIHAQKTHHLDDNASGSCTPPGRDVSQRWLFTAALIARRAMGGTGDHGHDIAVIDLVLHMYSRAPTRRRLSELWCVAPPGSRRFF